MREPKKFPNEEDHDFRERHHNYRAFMTRCKLTEIKKSHHNNEQFPYTADELALYMQYLCDSLEPIVEEIYQSEISDEQIEVDREIWKREKVMAAGFPIAPDYDAIMKTEFKSFE